MSAATIAPAQSPVRRAGAQYAPGTPGMTLEELENYEKIIYDYSLPSQERLDASLEFMLRMNEKHILPTNILMIAYVGAARDYHEMLQQKKTLVEVNEESRGISNE